MRRATRAIAGVLVLTSALLAYFFHKNWLFIVMFVGLNLLQYAFTNWCLMEKIFDAFGLEKELS